MLKPLDIQPLYAYKGATFEESIVLRNIGGEIQHLASGEKLILGIRPHYSSVCIIQKIWTINDEINNVYPINITPEEMDIEPDEYRYDVSLQTSDGDFYKIIPDSPFTVLNSSTYKIS